MALLLALAAAGCRSGENPQPVRSADLSARQQTAALYATDALLANQLAAALKVDPMTQDAEIQVAVTQGHARLSGFVNNAAAKLRAGELAQQADGIVAVENRLILRYHANLATDPLGGSRVRL
jgi:osmotically-inducible protein OsmY